jgi:adenylate kinase
MVRVVAVFGLSGVGKSWLIARMIHSEPMMHVQASQLLRDEKAAITGQTVTNEALRTGAVLDNQSLLVRAFSRVHSAATMPIIFDGHCVVDSAAGLIEIPPEVIEALSISGIVFIEDQPGAIVERRAGDTTRTRPIRSESEIELHQNQALATCLKYAARLQAGLRVVQAGDEPAFRSAIMAIMSVLDSPIGR